MNKKVLTNIAYFIAFSFLWSAVFIKVLHSAAGIGVGICFGVATANSFGLLMKNNDEKENNKTDNRKGK